MNFLKNTFMLLIFQMSSAALADSKGLVEFVQKNNLVGRYQIVKCNFAIPTETNPNRAYIRITGTDLVDMGYYSKSEYKQFNVVGMGGQGSEELVQIDPNRPTLVYTLIYPPSLDIMGKIFDAVAGDRTTFVMNVLSAGEIEILKSGSGCTYRKDPN